jgi:protein-tyrosine-phosphatase
MDSKSGLKVAVVCSSNMNRSMEAHAFLAKKGYNVDSYGTGDKVSRINPFLGLFTQKNLFLTTKIVVRHLY